MEIVGDAGQLPEYELLRRHPYWREHCNDCDTQNIETLEAALALAATRLSGYDSLFLYYLLKIM